MIQVGDKIPDGTLLYVPYTPNEDILACPIPQPYKIHDNFKGKKVVLFAIPGPFTPACSNTHVPGYVNARDALQSKGVSEVVCMSVADGFVMNAFAKASHTGDKVIMAGDGSAEFTKTLGLDQDLTANGMGIRSKRFAIVVDDLTVTYVGVETARGVSVSGADAVLAKL
ncbi:Redoxin [Chlamydoabsidia padenii]|nr:Redoxin [Chlamydoabsidia padenii]